MHDDTRAAVDPDVGGRVGRLGAVLLVGAGGAAGTAARMLVASAVPDRADVPVAILAVNLGGAFVLGLLLQLLTRTNDATRDRLRLLLGTGFLGGFTTYSALATDTALLLASGSWAAGIGYPLATVVIGFLASSAGIAVGQRLPGRRGSAGP